MPCRAANAAYVQAHRSPVGLVAADTARRHLAQLAEAGIGIRQAAQLSGVNASTVAGVRSGRLVTVRPSTSARLLGIGPTLAPSALVPATVTWRFVDSLEREGYTRRELAWHLGARSQQLQLGRRRIEAQTAVRLAAAYQRLAE